MCFQRCLIRPVFAHLRNRIYANHQALPHPLILVLCTIEENRQSEKVPVGMSLNVEMIVGFYILFGIGCGIAFGNTMTIGNLRLPVQQKAMATTKRPPPNFT